MVYTTAACDRRECEHRSAGVPVSANRRSRRGYGDREAALVRKARVVWIAYALAALVVAGCGFGPVSKAERGRLVFRTCTPCHGENGTGNADLHAPNIAGLPEWYITL